MKTDEIVKALRDIESGAGDDCERDCDCLDCPDYYLCDTQLLAGHAADLIESMQARACRAAGGAAVDSRNGEVAETRRACCIDAQQRQRAKNDNGETIHH